jgi:hypothetical protein
VRVTWDHDYRQPPRVGYVRASFINDLGGNILIGNTANGAFN